MTVNHNQRVLKALRDDGYIAQVVERWDSFSRKKHDLFTIIDVLAVGHGETKAIQVTSRSNMASRRHKMHESEELKALLQAGWSIEIWGFDKPEGHARWRRKVEMVSLPLTVVL